MKLAAHQPNYCPWIPFFYKMAMADKFVILTRCQFEKNGYQNRFKHKDKWITKPVKKGLNNIWDKNYVDGQNLVAHNLMWIKSIKDMLSIDTEILVDSDISCYRSKAPEPREYLPTLVKYYKCNTYVTNPDAFDKYLDRESFIENGIEIEDCIVPKHLRMSIFEGLEKYGIEGLRKQLPRR